MSAKLTSLSAPSMQRYLAPRSGFALFMTSARRVPVNKPVERPAEPHEKPFVFRTVFCSFRLFPAHTSVIGSVTCSKLCKRSRNVRINGFSTRLNWVRWRSRCLSKQVAYPSTLTSHDMTLSSRTLGTAP